MDTTARPSAHFRLTSRSEDTRRILDCRPKLRNFKRAPVGGALFPNPRLRVRNEDEKCDSSEATVILSHRAFLRRPNGHAPGDRQAKHLVWRTWKEHLLAGPAAR